MSKPVYDFRVCVVILAKKGTGYGGVNFIRHVYVIPLSRHIAFDVMFAFWKQLYIKEGLQSCTNDKQNS